MNTTNTYESKLPEITAIPDSSISKRENIPVTVFLQEARNLYDWCQADKEKLIAGGFDWKLVEDMPARITALREAQSIWAEAKNRHKKSEAMWIKKKPVAAALNKENLHNMRFAFRKQEDLKKQLSAIRAGSTQADMIQDLNDLAVLGRKNTELLSLINFDMSKLELASSMSEELSALLAGATTGRAESMEAMKIRDKASRHLKECVDDLRGYGQFVFWQESTRARGYACVYTKKLRRKAASKKTKEETVETE